MQKGFKKLLAIILSFICCLVSSLGVIAVDSEYTEFDSTAVQVNTHNNNVKYKDYIKEYSGMSAAAHDAKTPGGDFAESNDCEITVESIYENKENVLLWKDGNGSVTWNVYISESGLYNFELTFLPLKSGSDIEFSLMINGVTPFSELETVRFSRDWIDATEEPRIDSKGNEFAPEQCESGNYVYRTATDNEGVELQPYLFGFSSGWHTVTLVGKGYPVAIAEIGFTAPEAVDDYATVSKGYKFSENSDAEPIVIHAEDAVLKNDNSLIPKSVSNDSGMYPRYPFSSKINCIGGSNWQSPGQKITWEFEVETAGYYYFGARYKQNELINAESWRWLKIDGKTPFKEAAELRFKYGTGWQYYEMSVDGKPYYIWLDKGVHTLSLEVTLGDMAYYYEKLSAILDEIGNMYLEIIMITGETPDINRDYELFRQIPDFTSVLTDLSKQLEELSDEMKHLTGKGGSQYTAAVENMNRVISQMLRAEYLAHIYVNDYYTNYTTLSSWLAEMRKMPLTIDEMQLVPAGSDMKWERPNFFEKFKYSAQRLLSSYIDDYDIKSNKKAELKIWINWGRDQATVLNSLIEDSFTSQTGIEVDLQIVSNSLINGLLSNDFPDLQLHLSRTDPVNYGMRGALADLTQFPDYKEVLQRFNEGADIPYWYDGALYALPDTQTFYCMFYRTDIFEQLNLSVPTNWEEFLYASIIIQRNNMSVYMPYTQITSSTTVNSGIGSLNLYPTFMMQNGLSIYNAALDATEIDSAEGIRVFEEWTKLYTDYGYLKEADFYNRFRNGSMPLGIAPYTTYLTFYSAAPEIYGRWDIANVPGTVGGNSYTAGGGTGCSIVEKSDHKEEAWEFLKWWTSAETQIRYNNNVESVIGILGRTATANREALSGFSWNPGDLEKLLAQWDNVREVPEIPGSYYLTRAVDQAFWSVINDNTNPKDAVTKWAMVADGEISRKIEQYS